MLFLKTPILNLLFWRISILKIHSWFLFPDSSMAMYCTVTTVPAEKRLPDWTDDVTFGCLQLSVYSGSSHVSWTDSSDVSVLVDSGHLMSFGFSVSVINPYHS